MNCARPQMLWVRWTMFAPGGMQVVAPVAETSPSGQAVQGGAPVLLKKPLKHKPVSLRVVWGRQTKTEGAWGAK